MEKKGGPSGRPVLVSNAEVMEILQKRLENRATQKKSHHTLRHRDWIESNVYEYLCSTPCGRLDPQRREELHHILQSKKKRQAEPSPSIKTDDSDADNVNGNSVMKKTIKSGFGLTEAESLQVLNFAPTELVEIHLMIDDLNERLSEKDQEDLLALVTSYAKKDSPQDEHEGEDEHEDETFPLENDNDGEHTNGDSEEIHDFTVFPQVKEEGFS